jgi:hypothetical protein
MAASARLAAAAPADSLAALRGSLLDQWHSIICPLFCI